jgi:hypothetical protein
VTARPAAPGGPSKAAQSTRRVWLTLRQVVFQAQAGDVGRRRVIADAGGALGVAVAGVCNLLAPERGIVGGELAQAGDLLLDPLRDAVERSAIAATREVPVLAGVLGERADVLGAVPWSCASRSASWPRRRRRARGGHVRARLRPAKFSVWLWQFGHSNSRFSSRLSSLTPLTW